MLGLGPILYLVHSLWGRGLTQAHGLKYHIHMEVQSGI